MSSPHQTNGDNIHYFNNRESVDGGDGEHDDDDNAIDRRIRREKTHHHTEQSLVTDHSRNIGGDNVYDDNDRRHHEMMAMYSSNPTNRNFRGATTTSDHDKHIVQFHNATQGDQHHQHHQQRFGNGSSSPSPSLPLSSSPSLRTNVNLDAIYPQLQSQQQEQQQQSLQHPDKRMMEQKGYLEGISSYIKQISFSDLVKDIKHRVQPQQNSSNQRTSHTASNSQSFEPNKDLILWTQFQFVQHYYNTGEEKSKDQPTFSSFKKLYLILAYENGFQVFDTNDPNNIKEVVSLRQQYPVKLAKILPQPSPAVVSNMHDNANEFLDKHPLIAVVCTEEFSTVPSMIKFYSLKLQEYVHELDMGSEIYQIECKKDLLVVATRDQITWFDSKTLEKIVHFTCFPNINPYGVMALGDRWLAYPGNSLVRGSHLDFTSQSISEFSMGIAKKAASGIYYLGDLGLRKMSEYINSASSAQQQAQQSSDYNNGDDDQAPQQQQQQQQQHLTDQELKRAGTVEIRDTKTKQIISHFRAHSEPIAAMSFDKSGTLLVTASIEGSYLNVFQILPVASFSSTSRSYMSRSNRTGYGGIRHLYKLYRGITSASIQNIQFSINSKWISVSSAHGTTHLFAINPLGGQVTPLTHTSTSSSAASSPSWEAEEHHRHGSSVLHSVHPQKPTTLSAISRIHNALAMTGAGEISPRAVFHSPIATVFYTSALNMLPNASRKRSTERMLISTSTGLLMYYTLEPYVTDSIPPLRGSSAPHRHNHQQQSQRQYRDGRIDVKIQLVGKWDMCRSKSHDTPSRPIVNWELLHGSGTAPRELDRIDNCDLPLHDPHRMEDIKSRWISNVEIETYVRPSVPIWMTGQFKFKTFDVSAMQEDANKSVEESVYEDIEEEEQKDESNQSTASSLHTSRQRGDVIIAPMSPEKDDLLMQSLVIKITDPIPINRMDKRFHEPSAPPVHDEEVTRAMETPIYGDVANNEKIDHYFLTASPGTSPSAAASVHKPSHTAHTQESIHTSDVSRTDETTRASAPILMANWNENYFSDGDDGDDGEEIDSTPGLPFTATPHRALQENVNQGDSSDDDNDETSELDVQDLIALKDKLSQQHEHQQSQPVPIHSSPLRNDTIHRGTSNSVESNTSADEMASRMLHSTGGHLEATDNKSTPIDGDSDDDDRVYQSQHFEMKEDFYENPDQMAAAVSMDNSFYKGHINNSPSFSPHQDMLEFEDSLSDVSEASTDTEELL